MSTPTASPLKIGGEELLSLGYRIVPITPRQKFPGEYVAGRWKGMDTWERWRDRSPTTFEFSLWQRWPEGNVGIVLGSPAGDGMVVIAIDLDMKDEATVRRVVNQLPSTPMSKRGAKGETLFYKAPPTIRTRAFNRPLDEFDAKGRRKQERLADFLTGNQTRQTVAPPSRHPDGFNYVWLRGPVAASDLPVFDENDLVKFEGIMKGLGWDAVQATAPEGIKRAAPKPAKPVGEVVHVDMAASVHKKLNAAALANLDAWVPALDLYKCQKARAGYEAVATWRPSSTGQPDEKRKRNLSIQPTGIQDFGTTTNYSPLDVIMKSENLTFAKAYEWLRQYIEPQDDSGVVLAFDPPVRRAPKASDEMLPADTVAPSAPPSVIRVAPAFLDDDIAIDEWPDELCFPQGIVGHFAKWMDATATAPAPLLAYGASLMLVGTVAGRQFIGPTQSGTHLYAIGAAPTGGGKNHPMRCVRTALHDANMSELIGPSDYTSDSAILTHLIDRPVSVSLMDEFGSLWKRINSHRAGTFEAAITKTLREQWGQSFDLMLTKQYAQAGMGAREIWWPALSILGMTTPDEFFGALSAADLENGMVNRLLVLSTMRRARDRRSREELKRATFAKKKALLSCPAHLIDALKSIRDWQSEILGPQFARSGDIKPNVPLVAVTATPDAEECLFSYKQWVLDEAAQDPKFGLFYSRAFESAVRVATIHAIGRAVAPGGDRTKPPNIERFEAEHAVRLVDWSLRKLWGHLAEHERPDTHRDLVRAVFRTIAQLGGKGVSRSQLLRKLNSVAKARELSEAVTELIDAGWINAVEGRPTEGQKNKTTLYTIAQYPSWAPEKKAKMK